MANTFKYYRYEGYSYRIEFDPEDIPVGGAMLELNSSWNPIDYGWYAIVANNTPITEEQAYRLAGVTKEKI